MMDFSMFLWRLLRSSIKTWRNIYSYMVFWWRVLVQGSFLGWRKIVIARSRAFLNGASLPCDLLLMIQVYSPNIYDVGHLDCFAAGFCAAVAPCDVAGALIFRVIWIANCFENNRYTHSAKSSCLLKQLHYTLHGKTFLFDWNHQGWVCLFFELLKKVLR